MATLPQELQDELTALTLGLDGVQSTRYLTIAATTCLLYDMFLTLDQEVEYFWKTGRWSLSRVLFFLNRYFPPIVVILCLLGLFVPNLSVKVYVECLGLVHANFFLAIIALAMVQAVIVLRICYVYSKNLIVRAFVIVCFVACTVVTLAIYGKIWHDVDSVAIALPPGLKLDGCTAPPSHQVWKVFLPNLGLHTLLYLATTVPMLRMRRIGKQSRLLNRLVRDGGIFYFSVFGEHPLATSKTFSVRLTSQAVAMFSTIGSLSKSPLVTLPAIYSNLLLAIGAVSVSRLMLSIRSLAQQLSVSPDWLLNNTELSRVNWKHGARNGELIVEIEPIEEDVEMASVDEKRAASPAVYTTRVGVLEHAVYPGTRDYKAPPRSKRAKVAFHDEDIM
ncbi:hypothetical protein BC628DRAFT_1417409 [Trametes gibbosa]|nr:hypothetical protein BC628DRAFT_1417409 [Trametes gibbosa]